MNIVILSGNLVKVVENTKVGDKSRVGNTLAVRRDYKNKNGEYDTDFIDFEIWGAQADYLVNYAKKGSKITISGCLRKETYESNGQTRYITKVLVDKVLDIAKTNDTPTINSQEQVNVAQKVVAEQQQINDNDLPF